MRDEQRRSAAALIREAPPAQGRQEAGPDPKENAGRGEGKAETVGPGVLARSAKARGRRWLAEG